MLPKNRRDKDNREQFGAYRLGWRHGSLSAATDPKLTDHPNTRIRDAYQLGYEAGRRAYDRDMRSAAATYEINLVTAVLR